MRLHDPGALLCGRIELRCELGELESAAWVEYQACPAGSFAWRALARSEAAPFSACFDSAALPDGAYDLRVLVGRRGGAIEGSRALRGCVVENGAGVSLHQPRAGAWVGGAVALRALPSPAAAELPVRFQFSRDGEHWRPMLRARRVGPGAALWYTSGLPDGDYLLRAAVGGEVVQAASAPVAIHLDNTPPSCHLGEPRRFAVLRGSVLLLAEVFDSGSGVAAVEFEYAPLTGAWSSVGSTRSSPYSLHWQTQGLPAGGYRVRCLARDCLGNRAASEPVTVLLAAAREPAAIAPEPALPQAERPSGEPPPDQLRTLGARTAVPGAAATGHIEARFQRATLWQLERLLAERGGSGPRQDERAALLYALRAVAQPDGTIPPEFKSLLAEPFGELLVEGA